MNPARGGPPGARVLRACRFAGHLLTPPAIALDAASPAAQALMARCGDPSSWAGWSGIAGHWAAYPLTGACMVAMCVPIGARPTAGGFVATLTAMAVAMAVACSAVATALRVLPTAWDAQVFGAAMAVAGGVAVAASGRFGRVSRPAG